MRCSFLSKKRLLFLPNQYRIYDKTSAATFRARCIVNYTLQLSPSLLGPFIAWLGLDIWILVSFGKLRSFIVQKLSRRGSPLFQIFFQNQLVNYLENGKSENVASVLIWEMINKWKIRFNVDLKKWCQWQSSFVFNLINYVSENVISVLILQKTWGCIL